MVALHDCFQACKRLLPAKPTGQPCLHLSSSGMSEIWAIAADGQEVISCDFNSGWAAWKAI